MSHRPYTTAIQTLAVLLAFTLFSATAVDAKKVKTKKSHSNHSFGVRAGFDTSSDLLLIGVQAELGRALESARFAPSLDLALGNGASELAINADFRWYLFRLPESGIRFYGSAGPTIMTGSGGGKNNSSSTEIGLSLVAGMRIPMSKGRRYNLEARFGVGNIPDFRIMLGILF